MPNLEETTVRDLVRRTRQLRELFKHFESPQWGIETLLVELVAEVGTLADTVMISQGRRRPRAGQRELNLQDDIADVLFILLLIADEHGIDVESAYLEMLEVTTRKLAARKAASPGV